VRRAGSERNQCKTAWHKWRHRPRGRYKVWLGAKAKLIDDTKIVEGFLGRVFPGNLPGLARAVNVQSACNICGMIWSALTLNVIASKSKSKSKRKRKRIE
jgi:hypothetical protein